MRMFSSGVHSCQTPSTIERNRTPSSEWANVSASEKIWNPPESVRRGRFHPMNECKPARLAR